MKNCPFCGSDNIVLTDDRALCNNCRISMEYDDTVRWDDRYSTKYIVIRQDMYGAYHKHTFTDKSERDAFIKDTRDRYVTFEVYG